MRFKIHITLLLLIPILSIRAAYAQTTGSKSVSITLPTFALLDVEPTGAITMNFSPPTEAGAPLTNPIPNTSKWINYTSAIVMGGSTRNITASISSTILGMDIKLQAAAATGLGGGSLGIPSGEVTLSTSPQNIITGIGGAFTGDGTSNGHQLTIKIVPTNYADLTAQSNTQIQITYTISAN